MLLGAAVLSADDERTLVWQATADMAAGSDPVHLEPVLVALGSAQSAYVAADTQPTGQLTTPIVKGQLIPHTALDSFALDMHLVTVGVEVTHAPVGVMSGQVVDVWATSETGETVLVLPQARVTNVAEDTMRGGLRVVLDVPPADIARIIAAVRTQQIDLVAVPVLGTMP